MASVYKRGCDKSNKRAPWYFSYKDEQGRWRQRKGFTDKSATERLAIKLEDEARMVREGIKQAEPEPEKRVASFQLEEYIKHLKQRDVSHTQLTNLRSRIKKTLAACNFQLVTQIQAQPVEDYLAKRRLDGMSKQTSNHYRQAVHQFCEWLVKRSLLRSNPVADIPKLNVETDRRHHRRALLHEEFLRLIRAAEMGKPIQTIEGIDRAMIYILAAWTGYRRREIASLALTSFQLDSVPPTVTLEARHSKRRKSEVQVLHPEVVSRLRKWLEIRKPIHEIYLFPLSKESCGYDRATAKMMKADLSVAREAWIEEAKSPEEQKLRQESDFLLYKNEAGLFADFHANRHTFITNLARAGVAPKVAQTLARHSDIRLTMNVYTHTDLSEKVEAVARLPAPIEDDKPMADADESNGHQQHSSKSWAGSDTIGHRKSDRGNGEKQETRKNLFRKSKRNKDLARQVAESRDLSQVHPNGFEPLTFGSCCSMSRFTSRTVHGEVRPRMCW